MLFYQIQQKDHVLSGVDTEGDIISTAKESKP